VAEYRADYGARDDSWSMVVAAARELGAGVIARRSGLDRRTSQRAIRRNPAPTTPHPANRARIADAAAAQAAIHLEALGQPPLGGTLSTLLADLRYSEQASSVPNNSRPWNGSSSRSLA
jgi:predicted alpha/beta-hydrolase family hydrolase